MIEKTIANQDVFFMFNSHISLDDIASSLTTALEHILMSTREHPEETCDFLGIQERPIDLDCMIDDLMELEFERFKKHVLKYITSELEETYKDFE
jgi:hypothetical protein